jgi:hypothetical protein
MKKNPIGQLTGDLSDFERRAEMSPLRGWDPYKQATGKSAPKVGGSVGAAANNVKDTLTGKKKHIPAPIRKLKPSDVFDGMGPPGAKDIGKKLSKTAKKMKKDGEKTLSDPEVQKRVKEAQWNPVSESNIPKYESIVETKNGINGPVDVLRNVWWMGNSVAWKNAQQKKVDLQQYQAMDMAKQQGLSNQRQAFGQLAMRGGLSGGAGASMMKQNMRDINLAQQGVLANSNLNRLGVDTDAANMDRENRQIDISTMTRDKELGTAAKNNTYDIRSKAWAANKAAGAIANSKPEKGFLDRTWDFVTDPFKRG